MLSVKPPYPSIPLHTESYRTLLPCALSTCDLFLHSKILYFVSRFCKRALPLAHAAALPAGALCPGLPLFPPPARSSCFLPFHLVLILQAAFPQSSYFCPLLAPSRGFCTGLLRYRPAFLRSLAAPLVATLWVLPHSSCGVL